MTASVRQKKNDGYLRVAVDAAVEPAPGDLCYQEVNDARPFASATDLTVEELNQQYVAARFLGVCVKGKNVAGSAGEALINRDPNAEYEYPCPSTTFEVFDLVGPSENGDGDGLENQQVEKVTDASEAIGYAICRGTSITTVKVRLGRLAVLEAVAHQIAGAAGGTNVQTLAAELALSALSPSIQLLDPGGADRDVLLPPEAEGLVFTIVNQADMDETLSVKEDSDMTVQAYLRRGEYATFVCTGSAWLLTNRGYKTGLPYGLPATIAVAGNSILTDLDQQVQRIDPTGSTRTVDLPAASGLNTPFVIVNTADMAEDLTVRLTGGGATVVTVSQSEEALLVPDGTNWVPLLGKAT